MSFNDDEPIGPRPKPITEGRVTVKPSQPETVSVEASDQTVMLKLTGSDSPRLPLDLVAVLDISGSMLGVKIDKMKTAMQFVIQKLDPIDRLSLVTFASAAKRLCPLRQVTEASKPDLLKFIADLNADGQTNISDGLSIALKVLNERKNSSGRVGGVMLMSDGEQNVGDAAQVAIGKVPVYTFGFGADYECNVLHAVAKNSMGGTFNTVGGLTDLSTAFAQSIAGLLTVVVLDLKLTVSRYEEESIIKKVNAGSYPQTPDVLDASTVSVTVSFGELSSKEARDVIVDLRLKRTDESDYNATILEYKFSYDVGEPKPFRAEGQIIVLRTGEVGPGDDLPAPEVRMEMSRLETVKMIKAARTLADGKNISDAQDKVALAQNALFDVKEQSSPLVRMLFTELAQLAELMKTQDVYDKQGRPYALSAETSHDLQRFATRGSVRLFATPRMDKYLEQAKKFDEDPKAPPPSADEDVKEERAANPLAPISGPITFYIQNAIQALQGIERLINNGGKA